MEAPATSSRDSTRTGLLYGIAAYGTWGLVPLYFKLLAHVPSHAVLAHRIVWSVVFLAALIVRRNRWNEVRACFFNKRVMLTLLASTCMIAVNWYTFIWAVAH